ncbi:MAG: hypothetical protein UW22_C0046G0001 [Candidatus Gottesmanbacteria bacterium GW2011_GWB1_44_11c]|uniref:Uncharacterized protein n=1 Tax=Candidatus Gottesmanbacteria bacterium GW2011_GWB1_44_11c TaxID=1618447 RepID=A0A0G1GLX5_9BACT|nr:MAG: hypothetical protein UW22_C0046G0001 [Candidatus Gottesmanbacteria bacterium GW2011_GWB1_44_11c]
MVKKYPVVIVLEEKFFGFQTNDFGVKHAGLLVR